jgi:hypothetical protein
MYAAATGAAPKAFEISGIIGGAAIQSIEAKSRGGFSVKPAEGLTPGELYEATIIVSGGPQFAEHNFSVNVKVIGGSESVAITVNWEGDGDVTFSRTINPDGTSTLTAPLTVNGKNIVPGSTVWTGYGIVGSPVTGATAVYNPDSVGFVTPHIYVEVVTDDSLHYTGYVTW